MTDDNRITLIIEGLPEDEGRVRFSVFVAELQSLSATIGRLDKDANNGQAASYFSISELSYNSPVRVVLEPHPIKRHTDVRHIIMAHLGRVANAFDTDSDLMDIDPDLLEDFRNMARPVGKSVRSAALLFNGVHLNLTQKIATRVDEALAADEESFGSIEGMLEQINIHQGANTFHIYPDIGPKKVACNFPSRLYGDAVSAVGRRVEVSGLLRYRARSNFPYQIAVNEIDAYASLPELPDWEDLRGLAPDATGDLPTEIFVRELRNGWR